jgi:hypothetical protein
MRYEYDQDFVALHPLLAGLVDWGCETVFEHLDNACVATPD